MWGKVVSRLKKRKNKQVITDYKRKNIQDMITFLHLHKLIFCYTCFLEGEIDWYFTINRLNYKCKKSPNNGQPHSLRISASTNVELHGKFGFKKGVLHLGHNCILQSREGTGKMLAWTCLGNSSNGLRAGVSPEKPFPFQKEPAGLYLQEGLITPPCLLCW